MPPEGGLDTWRELDPLESGTGGFPPFLEDEEIEARVVTWIRIGVSDMEKVGPNGWQLRVVGINAASVTQRARVSAEFIGLGNGQPDQVFQLVNTPVLEDGVRLTVNGEVWGRIDDIASAGAEVRRETLGSDLPTSSGEQIESEEKIDVYTIDRESGELRFGDGLHGPASACGRRDPGWLRLRRRYPGSGGRERNHQGNFVARGRDGDESRPHLGRGGGRDGGGSEKEHPELSPPSRPARQHLGFYRNHSAHARGQRGPGRDPPALRP